VPQPRAPHRHPFPAPEGTLCVRAVGTLGGQVRSCGDARRCHCGESATKQSLSSLCATTVAAQLPPGPETGTAGAPSACRCGRTCRPSRDSFARLWHGHNRCGVPDGTPCERSWPNGRTDLLLSCGEPRTALATSASNTPPAAEAEGHAAVSLRCQSHPKTGHGVPVSAKSRVPGAASAAQGYGLLWSCKPLPSLRLPLNHAEQATTARQTGDW
jgi:hypothetical protein